MACSSVYATSPELITGSEYIVSIGDEAVSVLPTETFTVIGTPIESSENSYEQEGSGDGGFEWHSHYNGN